MSGAYYNEIDPFAAAWLRELIKAGHIAAGEVDERSILDVSADDLRGFRQCHWFAGIGVWSYALRCAGWPDDRQVWTGSCPCQPLSSAGQQRGHADERHLWPAFHALIALCRPATVLGEQVASKDGREWFAAVRADLERSGYACGAADLAAAGVGAPHIRQRLFFVADANDARLEGATGPLIQGRSDGPAGDGAAGELADARDDRSQGRLRERPEPDRLSDGGPPPRRNGADGRLADADDWHQPQVGEGDAGARRGRPIEPAGTGAAGEAGRLADADTQRVRGGGRGGAAGAAQGDGRQAQEPERIRPDAGPDGEKRAARPSEGDSFWSTCDWLLCRDGKWRPTLATHVTLAPRATAGMVRGSDPSARTDQVSEETEGEIDAGMSGVRSGVGAENVPFRAAGDAVGILKEDVLFDPMCAEGTGKGEMQRGTSDPHKSASRDERPLRSVWGGSGGEEAGGSPQGRGSIQQQSLELDDVVRLLPPSRALASLYGRSEDGEALLVLQQAIESEISLHHASGTLAEVWASLGPKEKDRIRERVGFDAARWELVVPFPLSSGEPARVGRLRGYGNSLCAPVAQAFIEAVMLVR